jgi:hypothetical protein
VPGSFLTVSLGSAPHQGWPEKAAVRQARAGRRLDPPVEDAAAAPSSIAAAARSRASDSRSTIGAAPAWHRGTGRTRRSRRRVEQDDVAHGALFAVEHASHDLGVVLRIAAEQVVDVGQRDAEVSRIEVVLVDVASADLPHGCGRWS